MGSGFIRYRKVFHCFPRLLLCGIWLENARIEKRRNVGRLCELTAKLTVNLKVFDMLYLRFLWRCCVAHLLSNPELRYDASIIFYFRNGSELFILVAAAKTYKNSFTAIPTDRGVPGAVLDPRIWVKEVDPRKKLVDTFWMLLSSCYNGWRRVILLPNNADSHVHLYIRGWFKK